MFSSSARDVNGILPNDGAGLSKTRQLVCPCYPFFLVPDFWELTVCCQPLAFPPKLRPIGFLGLAVISLYNKPCQNGMEGSRRHGDREILAAAMLLRIPLGTESKFQAVREPRWTEFMMIRFSLFCDGIIRHLDRSRAINHQQQTNAAEDRESKLA